VGAAVSGALALELFGSKWMALFSAILTLLILVFSEIIPKTVGAHYWKSLGPVSAYILKVMILILKPLIIPIHFLSNLMSRNNPAAMISKAEIYNYIKMGYHQGVLESPEFEIYENMLNLQSTSVRDIMTPRTVTFWLPPKKKVGEVMKEHRDLPFSRIPLYNSKTNEVHGFALRREIVDCFTQKKTGKRLEEISTEPLFVPESMTVYTLLDRLIKKKTHMAAVLNEFGDYTGIVTMEDAVETLLGREIVDEFDTDIDMRKVARDKQHKGLKKSKGR
jgi:CBS domain containing-hemolysin-like protein